MTGFVDFNEVKSRVSIVEAAERLGIKAQVSNRQLRAPCPSCGTGGERALAITPAKNLFYCFAAQKGGDQIQLVAHCLDKEVKDAASWLGGTVENRTVEKSTGTVRKDHAKSDGFQALEYLEPEHDAVLAVGFEPAVAKALGIGYAPKGILRGTVAVPLRLADGSIAGYIGVQEARLPTKWHGIDTTVVPFPKRA